MIRANAVNGGKFHIHILQPALCRADAVKIIPGANTLNKIPSLFFFIFAEYGNKIQSDTAETKRGGADGQTELWN